MLTAVNRYIGVLNVTYQKQARRKSVVKREDHKATVGARAASEAAVQDGVIVDSQNVMGENHRVISQSLQSNQGQVPTVTFVDNQHILPRHLLQPTPCSSVSQSRHTGDHTFRWYPSGTAVTSQESGEGTFNRPGLRPKVEEQRAHSWGATTVNKKLRNLVFNDAFLSQPVEVEKHRKGHQRTFPRKKPGQMPRSPGSDPTMIDTAHNESETGKSSAGSAPVKNSGQEQEGVVPADTAGDADAEDMTGTSAPEPEIITENLSRKKRRYSGTGLRRRPTDVSESRGNLKYFQDPDDTHTQSLHTRHSSKATSGIASPVPVAPRIPREPEPAHAHSSGHKSMSFRHTGPLR